MTKVLPQISDNFSYKEFSALTNESNLMFFYEMLIEIELLNKRKKEVKDRRYYLK